MIWIFIYIKKNIILKYHNNIYIILFFALDLCSYHTTQQQMEICNSMLDLSFFGVWRKHSRVFAFPVIVCVCTFHVVWLCASVWKMTPSPPAHCWSWAPLFDDFLFLLKFYSHQMHHKSCIMNIWSRRKMRLHSLTINAEGNLCCCCGRRRCCSFAAVCTAAHICYRAEQQGCLIGRAPLALISADWQKEICSI